MDSYFIRRENLTEISQLLRRFKEFNSYIVKLCIF